MLLLLIHVHMRTVLLVSCWELVGPLVQASNTQHASSRGVADICVSDDRRARVLGVAYLRLGQLQYLPTLLQYLAQWAATAPA